MFCRRVASDKGRRVDSDNCHRDDSDNDVSFEEELRQIKKEESHVLNVVYCGKQTINKGCGYPNCDGLGNKDGKRPTHRKVATCPYKYKDDIEKEGIGLIVKSGDVNGWINCANYLLENPDEVKKMGLKAYNLCKEIYNMDQFADNLSKHIKMTIK